MKVRAEFYGHVIEISGIGESYASRMHDAIQYIQDEWNRERGFQRERYEREWGGDRLMVNPLFDPHLVGYKGYWKAFSADLGDRKRHSDLYYGEDYGTMNVAADPEASEKMRSLQAMYPCAVDAHIGICGKCENCKDRNGLWEFWKKEREDLSRKRAESALWDS